MDQAPWDRVLELVEKAREIVADFYAIGGPGDRDEAAMIFTYQMQAVLRALEKSEP